MKSFELAVNIERVIRSLKNTWTIIKPAWGQGLQPGGKGGHAENVVGETWRTRRKEMQKETEGRMQRTVREGGEETKRG